MCGRLTEHRAQIEEAVLHRVYAISDPSEVPDPTYRAGLRLTVSAALDYALLAIERGEGRTPPPPPELLAQARLAARCGVGLDTVLRRYLAGYTLLGEFLNRELEQHLGGGSAFAKLLPGRGAILDRLLAAVSDEYYREARLRPESSERRRAERIERLLAGEPIDTSEFDYDFTSCHLGLVAVGTGVKAALRAIGPGLDCRILLVRRDESSLWAWLGSRRRLDPADLLDCLGSLEHGQTAIAVGEPADGITGWRVTHRQASAALPVAKRGADPVVRYADVALLASALQDDLLTESLRNLYLEPLSRDRNGGESLRETLRAYFAADRNVSSAAAALGVTWPTIKNRLSEIEDRLASRVNSSASEIELALLLEEFESRKPEAI
ncbi:MAG: PucR family transcriptional regulator [Nitrososphaerota archaeon]